MNPPRTPPKTLADHLSTGLAPVLIMVMVGSLVFFLLEITYAGRHIGRLRWTLFWFVLAMVLVARISIESGSGHGLLYGAAVACATGAILLRFIGPAPAAWFLLGLIWWCTHRLTIDSTQIDDDENASTEGLLSLTGLDPNTNIPAEREAAPSPPPRVSAQDSHRRSLHAPGLWVLYFSLAALPLFGIGQALLPNSDTGQTHRGFVFLLFYLAAALTLLLTTSFAGLRRYLRQRFITMPSNIAAGWVLRGIVTLVGILLLAALLPRPDSPHPYIVDLVSGFDTLRSKPLEASRTAILKGDPTPGPGDPGTGSEQPGKEGQSQGSGQAGGEGEQGPGTSDSQGQPEDGSPGSSNSQSSSAGAPPDDASPNPGNNTTPPSPPPNLPSPAPWLAWLFGGLFAAALVYAMWRRRQAILGGIRRLLESLRSLWSRLFGHSGGPRDEDASLGASLGGRPQPFSRFRNPFLDRTRRGMTLTELVCYTFHALRAWAHERGVESHPEDTPYEFAARLAEVMPDAGDEGGLVTATYVRVVYGGLEPSEDSTEALERLWLRMSEPAAPG